ncbi:MAG: DUF5107 domain-containing protein [Butyrivibrio sp.]|uniref:DUF5107 domain-containing protein n=1 Tax=Butyrivibrio sp. TaxID=28121 RepID=UPI001B12C269|nr:DUF5107 domain-containing protein [Butyrivibrio sp.]MBO6241662.1 DUF5107 domain-containing protein [Butyrivibrio sp.]
MGTAKIWEENVTIPTYEVGKPDKNPMFLERRVYQGSTGKIYPYPSTNEISQTKKDVEWRAVFLENEYIKVMILPQLGGRIQRAYDKTNDYDFVYYNRVIKPALVGLTGPWISGGIEFNWPQHHRPTTYSPVDYKITEGDDGSVTLITGDVDQMYGTKEITKFTLYPGKAFIEITGQLYNRTPLPQTFLWWANPAVSVNDYTQSIFPPDVRNVYDHGKRAVSRFPIATGEYYKHDYSEGVDISRYKNIPVPTSYMAEKSDFDFVGGYDYKKEAGLLHVADHHVSPGKKQWTWGCGDFGKAWDRNLTDEDGPYIELMTGMFCDNQPDFSWLKPYEEKTFKQYFMPYKKVGQVKNAGIHGALNVEVRDEEKLYICAYATEQYDRAKLFISYDGTIIYTEDICISPVKCYEGELNLKKLIKEALYDEKTAFEKSLIKVTLSDENTGKEIVSYKILAEKDPEFAEPAKALDAPEKIQTNEELFLAGQHIEQYRHATFLPDPYYLEGLKRDEGDIRINNAYGLLLFRRGRFELSEKYFKKAIKRLTRMHPNPYDSESFYNLGLSLFYQEKYDEAFDAFYKATWTDEQKEKSFYYLAAIACRNREYEHALEFIEQSLIKNSHSTKARALKAAILYKLGKKKDAAGFIEENLQLDTFDFVSAFIKAISSTGKNFDENINEFKKLTRGFHETYLYVARDMAESGFYEEAIKVLDLYEGDSPMIHYYLGAYKENIGDDKGALSEYQKAEASSPYLCFPNKLEDIAVLKKAIAADDKGSKARYYLGCLYYDKLQFDLAIEMYEASLQICDTFPTVFRNLSIAYYNKRGEKDKALTCLEKAFYLDRTDARVFLELDQLYQKLNVPLTRRLEKYNENIALIEKRDDLYTEYVTLLNTLGMNEEAHKKITGHSFRTWEGAEGKITTQFKVSLLQPAKELIKKGKAQDAEKMLLEALSYPENLGEGRLEGTKDNHIYYYLGLCYELSGQSDRAKECFEKATLGAMEVAGMMYYYDQPADMILYQGLAFEKLGDKKSANSRFYKLLDYGQKHLNDKFKMDYFAVSMPDMSVFDADMDQKNKAHCHYLCGLGYIGLGERQKAMDSFNKVLEIDNTHQNAHIYSSFIF